MSNELGGSMTGAEGFLPRLKGKDGQLSLPAEASLGANFPKFVQTAGT